MNEHKDEGAQQAANPAEVPAALTAEEWKGRPGEIEDGWEAMGPRCTDGYTDFWLENWNGGDVWYHTTDEGEQMVSNQHGLAALCLYQQSFGFSRADVAELDRAIRNVGEYLRDHGYPPDRVEGDAHMAALRSLAARIAAMLPPAETEER